MFSALCPHTGEVPLGSGGEEKGATLGEHPWVVLAICLGIILWRANLQISWWKAEDRATRIRPAFFTIECLFAFVVLGLYLHFSC